MANRLDRDPNDALLLMRTLPYAVLVAALLIAPAIIVAHVPWPLAVLMGVAAGTVVAVVAPRLTSASGDAMASLYAPGGSTTPPIRQYSLAESLVARGKYQEAAEAYELLAGDYPDDPEPALRMARLQRDKLSDYPQAAVWFKRALAAKSITSASHIGVTRELVELFTHKLRSPALALPFLARLSETNPGTPAAEWAKREYREIKQQMRTEHSDG